MLSIFVMNHPKSKNQKFNIYKNYQRPLWIAYGLKPELMRHSNTGTKKMNNEF